MSRFGPLFALIIIALCQIALPVRPSHASY